MCFPCMHTDIPERKFHDVIFCLSSFVHHFMFIIVLFLLFSCSTGLYRSSTLFHKFLCTVGGETYKVHRLTSLSVMISLQWILSERTSLNIAHLANQNNTQIHTQYEMTFLTQYTVPQGVRIREVPLTDIQ